ncbi:PREDICTED: LOW QUALITY PROTEIN: interleukin-20-like [Tinamus guttatus]|uniref:LOW QUALITY PROTEIN: interleukin-20-like n=1 Tax=Tinamus guttatus TaxID=94827 RepID=UPI00052EE1DB|nr:PREDICTED: LOW QUALITY PROTEIN: interleukin-20-like [Tinamus guttatus]
MKGSHIFLFSAMCWLMLAHGNKIFRFGPCRISMSMNEIRAGFAAIKANIVSIAGGSGGVGKPFLSGSGDHPALTTASLPAQQSRDPIRTVSILSHPHSLHRIKSSEKCCIIHHLFNFYVDKVFKYCTTEDSYVNRKISSIANSFLSIKRNLAQCHNQNMCKCGQESTEKFKQILANYKGLNVTSAAMKSLGELDILLDWMEKSR